MEISQKPPGQRAPLKDSKWRDLSLTSEVLYRQYMCVCVHLMFSINFHSREKRVILTNEDKVVNQLFRNYKCNL